LKLKLNSNNSIGQFRWRNLQRAIRGEVLIAELHSVIADQTAAADAAAFKARCRALLKKIPDPYW